jgi:hypothetical protein
MLQFGLRKGLSQSLGYDQKVADLHYNEQLNKQAQLMAEKKAQLFADDFEYTNAMNQHDNPLVKQQAQAKIKEIGAFVNANPDWQTNVGKRAQYKQLIHDLKDNPDLNRGMQSDANYKAFQTDLATKSKNPDLYDSGAYNEVASQWQNYIKYGNQYGEEAAKTQGKSPFVYTQPQDFVDLNAQGIDYGSKFNDFEVKPLKGGGSGSYQEIPKEASLNTLATDFYQRNKRQMDLRASQSGFTNGIEYAKSLIKPGIKTKFDYGDLNGDRQFALAMQKANKESEKPAPPAGIWSKDIVNTNANIVNGEVLKEALGAKPQLKIWNKDRTGFVDLSGNEVTYTGRNVYLGDDKARGQKSFEVVTTIPLAVAIEQGILNDDETKESSINPEWRQRVSFQKRKKYEGEPREVVVDEVVLRDFVPFNINSGTYKGIYETKASAPKFVSDPGTTETANVPTINTQAEYDALPVGSSYKDSSGQTATKR